MDLALSSIKDCWYKLSSRVGDYLSNYRLAVEAIDEVDSNSKSSSNHHHHHHHHSHNHHHHQHNNYRYQSNNHLNPAACDQSSAKDTNYRDATLESVHRQRLSSAGIASTAACTCQTKSMANFREPDRQNFYHNPTCPAATSITTNTTITEVDDRSRNLKTLNIDSSLPPGYRRRKTPSGQVYFVDPNGQKYWHDPSVPKELYAFSSIQLDSLFGELSQEWELRQAPSGKIYYVNHTRRTTQFTDPRLIKHKDFLIKELKKGKGQANFLKRNSNNPRVNTRQNNQSYSNRIDSLLGGLSSHKFNSITGNRHHHHHHHHHDTSYQNLDETSIRNPQSNISTNSSSRIAHQLSKNHHGSLHRPNNDLFIPPNSYDQTGSLRRQFPDFSSNSHRNLVRGSYQNLSTSNNSSARANFLDFTNLASHNPTISRQTSQQHHHQHDITSPTVSSTQNSNFSTSMDNLSSIDPAPSQLADTSESGHQQANSTSTKNNNNNRELFDKISILRQSLLKQQVIAHPCRIDVSRKKIFEDSYRVLSQLQPRDLRRRLLIKFRGEEGLDYGGVAREWFYLLSKQILSPAYGLFQYTGNDSYNLQINPDSGIVYKEHLSYLNFCGRVIGMAVFHGHFIEGRFTLPFYKMLLKKSITLSDIEFVDPELYRSLCWMLENDITNVIDTTFLVQHNAFGQLQEHELKLNGRNVVVTEQNKNEYVSLYVNYRCRRGIESQFEALQRGFYELISPRLLEKFEEHELELLIGGLSKINVEDWKLHTKLKNCTVETPLVRWFWDIVKSYDEDKRARLLQFVTGSPRVPIQGFKALQGVNSELRSFTIHLIKNACTDNLPKSHTCFNRIDLPPYESYERLRDKLTQAIEETMGFAMQ